MSKVKLVVFDLDGVLVELKEGHYLTLNQAIEQVVGAKYIISPEEHYKFYDGLPTKKKLELLTQYKRLPLTAYEEISKRKQEFTLRYVYKNIKPIPHLAEAFTKLKEAGYAICVASNSVSNTVYSVLVKQELLHHVDHVLSNQDVRHPKPNPEIYFKAMSRFGLTPKECLIVEDSPFGLDAAYESGAGVLRVSNPSEVTHDNIMEAVKKQENTKKRIQWNGTSDYNVLIPMAGAGSRFEQAGYTDPKPLIDVNGIPMIQKVVDNLGIDARFIFVVQKKHEQQYQVSRFLKQIRPGCEVVFVDGLTDGAACTTLIAKELINNDKHLLMANSDQFVEWDSARFYYQLSDKPVDASILTFKSTHPKWSFAKVDPTSGFVTEVAEKKPISDIATVGIYYWNKGSDYVKYAEQMINKNIRVNNEFYVCPVFNEAIQDGKRVSVYGIEKMWGLGTPEDLQTFLKEYKK